MLKLGCGHALDRLGERMGEAAVAEVVHMEAVVGKHRRERLGAFRGPSPHHRVAAQHWNAVFGADLIDDRDIALVARRIGGHEPHLRIDENKGHARSPHGGDAGLHGRAKQRLVDADQSVIGADLPDHQPRPTRFQRALEALQGLGGKLAADAGVPHVGLYAGLLGELVLEARRIGVRRRTGADPLGRRGADRQNVERTADASFREGERPAVRLNRADGVRTRRLVGARRNQCE
jgi:hypothetical protein